MFRIRRVGSWSDHEIRVQMKFMQRIAKKGKRDEKLGIEGLGKSGKSSSHLDFSSILDMMVCLKIEDSKYTPRTLPHSRGCLYMYMYMYTGTGVRLTRYKKIFEGWPRSIGSL